MQDSAGVHAEKVQKDAGLVKKAEDVDDGVSADDKPHQPGNRQARVQRTETVNGMIQLSQRKFLQCVLIG